MTADAQDAGFSALILGASGYGGGELLRLLTQHPRLSAVAGVSRQQAGKPLHATHPHLRGLVHGQHQAQADWGALAEQTNPVLFSALPHGEFARLYPAFVEDWQRHGLHERLTVIDLSGDFRLDDADAFAAAYGAAHPCPAELGAFVYGLSEWRSESLRGARRIANPGCFATAIQLGLLPLAGWEGRAGDWMAVSAITGSSGSGASPSDTTHHPSRAQDFRAYKVLAHQHEAEIRRSLREQGSALDFALVPHSAPLVRGIFVTIGFQLAAGADQAGLEACFEQAYRQRAFIRLLPGTPRVAAVAGSNFADIAVHVRKGSGCVLVAIDNLVKGMAGQAIQNLNLAMGWPEDLGLRQGGVFP